MNIVLKISYESDVIPDLIFFFGIEEIFGALIGKNVFSFIGKVSDNSRSNK